MASTTVNSQSGIESFFSPPGVAVIASVLVGGALLVFATGAGGLVTAVLLLLGLASGAWAWKQTRPAGQPSAPERPPTPRPAPPVKAAPRSAPPTPRKEAEAPSSPPAILRETPRIERESAPPPPVRREPPPMPEEAPAPAARRATPPPEEPPKETPKETPAEEPNPKIEALRAALEALPSDPSGGQTVRIESIASLVPSGKIVHLQIEGDGPQRDVWFGKAPGEPWPVEVGIGRHPPPEMAAVEISEKTVSSLQAQLTKQDDTFLIENTSQTNKTRVNGQPLRSGEKRPLADGDRIEMGPVSIVYRLE